MDDVAVAPEPARVQRSEPSEMDSAFVRAAAGRKVLIAALCLIVAQLGVRGWVAGNGFFYWDDLILVGRAGTHPLLSGDLLLHDHDGHFMPLAFATAWLVTAVAPLEWAGPVICLLVLQAAASVAVLRMLLVLLGTRWAILGPLVFYLFSPLTLPAFAWWAAALNALPLQFALAWVIADAMLLVRTGRRRYAVSGIVVTAVALLFFEKAIVVPFVAFAVAALARYIAGASVREVLRRGAALWVGASAVLACWLTTYLLVIDLSAVEGSTEQVDSLLPSAASAGVVTALLGGPWAWERWLPAAPWAIPPGWAVVAAWLALAVMVAVTVRRRDRVWPVWAAAGVYVVAVQVPVALARGGPNTANELMQSLRYLADLAVVLTAAGALLLAARPRSRRGLPWPPGPRTALMVGALFLASSLWSTYTFTRIWSQGQTETYITTAKSEFADWDEAPLLEQEVPWAVLNPTAYPQNLASHVLSPIAPPGAFADSTPHLRMITDFGHIVDAQVWWNRAIRPGPEPSCGYRLTGAGPVRLALDGPMLAHTWTAQLNYVASRDGRIAVSFVRGKNVTVPVREGMHTVYVRIVGSGSALQVRSHTPGLDLCIGSGPVGVASYDN